MKCPVCKTNVSELADVCPNCKTNFDEYEEQQRKRRREERRSNADCLNIMANLNLLLSIISAIIVWLNFSEDGIDINWLGIVGGIGILFVGFTLFFLLKTVADIYWKVEK